MAGINFKNSSIADREILSFSNERAGDISEAICNEKGVEGCIILSTCNRTEIYISCNEYFVGKPDTLLLKHSNIKNINCKFLEAEGIDVVYYIMDLACGLKSQIVGEGQIVSQLNNALEISLERGCTNSELDTLFRIAVSAGKYCLTNAKITNVPLSSAYGVVELLERSYDNLKGKSCVVIGNGKIGRIVQSLLIKKGCNVFVTLRSYKYGNNDIIKGCKAINYNDRYSHIENCDFVISATRSPHYTITYDKISTLNNMPDILIDLALPRDIEPSVKKLCSCYNIDELGYESKINDEDLKAVRAIVEKYVADFINWKNYKLSLPDILRIKNIISQRIVKSCNAEGEVIDSNMDCLVSVAVDKTVDILLGSMKEYILPETMENCRRKIEERARL